MTGWCNPI